MFIVFEGPKASGKTTIIQEIARKLKKDFHKIVVTNDDFFDLSIDESLEKRKILVNEIIQPALEKDEIVICERYFYSLLVYQETDELDRKIREDHRTEIGLYPDLVLYLKAPSTVLFERRLKRKDTFKLAEIEHEQREYRILEKSGIDTSKNLQQTVQECYEIIARKILNR